MLRMTSNEWPLWLYKWQMQLTNYILTSGIYSRTMPAFQTTVCQLICIAFLVLIPKGIPAQFEVSRFTHYTYKDGLSDDYIRSIAQDHRGYIWIGTEYGLNRFDGNRFEHYYQDVPKNFLHSSQIRKIENLTDKRLAILTHLRTQILDEEEYVMSSLFIPDSTPLFSSLNDPWDILEVPSKGIALTTAVGFMFYDTLGKLVFRYDAFTKEDIGMKRMLWGRNMVLLPGNQIFIYVESDKQGIYNIDTKKFKFISPSDVAFAPLCHPESGRTLVTSVPVSDHEFIIIPQDDSLIYYNVISNKRIASYIPIDWERNISWSSKITMLSDSTFALSGGESGFYIFNISKKTGQIKGDYKKHFESYNVNDVFLDKDHRLWIGTVTGLFKENLQEPFIQTFSRSIPEILSDKEWPFGVYFSMFRYEDRLYAGRYDRENGLVIMDPDNLEVQKTITFNLKGEGSNVVNDFEKYYEDTIWMASNNGILWLDTKTDNYGKVSELLRIPGFNRASILSPVQPDGYAWIAGSLNGFLGRYHVKSRNLRVFDQYSNPRIPFEKIKHIAFDAYGDVWIGGHSLARWNQRTSTFDTIMNSYGGPNKFNDNILMMEADDLGNLWLVNNMNGLLQYKTREAEWIYFGLERGFPSVIFQTISPVINDEIWLFDSHHLTRFNIKEGKPYSYDESDGLPIGHVQSKYMYYDELSKYMYMMVNNEICRWRVDNYPEVKPAGNLICQEVEIKGTDKIFFPRGKMRLNHVHNDLVFSYTVIDYELGQRYQFAYRLHPSDEWINLGDQRKLYLTNLNDGEYQVEFKARSISGAEKIDQMQLIISPPFWRTDWFLSLCLVALFVTGFFIYRRRIRMIHAKANIDKLLSEAEMKALHAQMNPHFIFNSLNSIRKLVLNNENYDASRYLGKFAHLIRMTLDQSRQSFISLRQTIDYLQRYVELERIRNPNFTCSIEVDESIDQDEVHLPPMLIQPFIENAIWHGWTPEKEGIDICVRFEKHGDQLVCTIDDNGIGIQASLNGKSESGRVHHGVGIENIRSRIELLNKKHNLKSTITLVDKASLKNGHVSGTCVTLRLPMEMNEA